MSFRDPDLGRDRTTAALGKRDWGFFDGSGVVPADREPAEAPWESLRHVSAHDRFDRTLGIPERRVSMWPLEARSAGLPDQHARAICDQLLAERRADRQWPDPATAVALLADIAGPVYGQATARQRQVIESAAGRFHVDPTVAFELAGGVGALIAQTAHRKAPEVPGAARLNLLAGAQLGQAVELFLARDLIRHAQAHSDPDLPRLWMLANGLAHGIAVSVMRAVPARSVGPAARIVPLHEDLVDWQAMRTVIEHMDATVTAGAEGRRWLDGTSRLVGADDAAMALGVVALTQPALAATMARHGPSQVTLQRARLAAGPTPAGVLDLSDAALKAMCDRSGWLLGAASERTERELVQSDVRQAGTDGLRERLADGDRHALDQAVSAAARSDAALDGRAFRKNPPAGDMAATQALLRTAGIEALARFADFHVEPRASYAEAFAHRFPAQLAKGALTEVDPARLAGPEAATAVPIARRRGGPADIDLGL